MEAAGKDQYIHTGVLWMFGQELTKGDGEEFLTAYK